jgi:hypothetical protein
MSTFLIIVFFSNGRLLINFGAQGDTQEGVVKNCQIIQVQLYYVFGWNTIVQTVTVADLKLVNTIVVDSRECSSSLNKEYKKRARFLFGL